jgi:hypothetical protein
VYTLSLHDALPISDQIINLTRTIRPEGDLFRINFHVTLPPDTTGSFVIYDRLPSNMRFVPLRRTHETGSSPVFFRVRHTQRQLVEIHLFANRHQSINVYYHAMQLFDADMASGTSFITNRRAENHIWGATQ